jgi:hypothetical protein
VKRSFLGRLRSLRLSRAVSKQLRTSSSTASRVLAISNIEAAVFHLDVDQHALLARPSEADLEAIDFDGVLRRCAERLRSVGNDPARSPDMRQRADEALVELYLRVAGDKEAA